MAKRPLKFLYCAHCHDTVTKKELEGTKFCRECRSKGWITETPMEEPLPDVIASPPPPEEPLPTVDPLLLTPNSEDSTYFPPAEADYTSPTSQEIVARLLARRKLLPFIKRFRPKYDAGWVHEDICRRLERFMHDVEDGKEPRLLLMMPVRMGKSEIASRHFAPWVLGQHPDWEIIAASGAQSLAISFSRYIRDLVRDGSYQALFPNMRLDASSQSAENWNTTYGGGYLAAGIGTMITGRGAHILIIDDPVKDAEAADSQNQRDATWEWYVSTALSRLAPGGGVLGIMTWWHDDDWAGRIQLLAGSEEADKFEIVKYPAVNDMGDEYLLADDSIVQLPPGSKIPAGARLTRPHNSALHPSRYSYEALMRRKATYYAQGNQRWWSALYQQNPAPDEGAYFTKKMFRIHHHRIDRKGCVLYQAWDFAIAEGEKNDYTVGCTILQDSDDMLYVMDIYRFKNDDGIDIMSRVVDYAQKWKPHLIGFEDGQIWKSLSSTFTKVCAERKFYPAFEILKPFTDKFVRAQPLRGRMQSGKISFHGSNAWFDEMRNEFLRFGAGGKHDDQVDAVSWCVRLTLSKAAPRPEVPKKQERYGRSLAEKLRIAERGMVDTSHMSA